MKSPRPEVRRVAAPLLAGLRTKECDGGTLASCLEAADLLAETGSSPSTYPALVAHRGGFVTHDALIACFNEAVDTFLPDAREEDLPKYVANLHRVERDTASPRRRSKLPSRLTD